MAKKSMKNESEKKKEFERRVCENMADGFAWSSENWSIRKITNAINDGKLIDPSYQRGKVWDSPKNKALIETILKYGGNKIPTLTLRDIGNGKYEMVDGKQRVWSAIKPFVDGEFGLNGVYIPELRSFKIGEIHKRYPEIYSAFMGTTIPVQIARGMSEEEAKTYFIQINESGVTMRIGEKIHANQGTPLIKVIEEMREHKAWNCIGHIGRYNDYAYISRMLLYIRDYGENQNVLKVYTNAQLMNELSQYLSFDVPKIITDELVNDLDILHTAISRNRCRVSVVDAFSLFMYIHSNKKDLYPLKFGKFVRDFYDNLETNNGVFRLFNQKKSSRQTNNLLPYYQWYLLAIDSMYTQYLKGAKLYEITDLRVKG